MNEVIIAIPELTVWCFVIWAALECLNILSKIALRILDWKINRLENK